MYCVKCGVRLSEGTERCPLCQTPVWNPDTPERVETTFSDRYPIPPKSKRYPLLAFVTAVLAAVSLSALIFCLKTLGGVYWSGYVMLGCALFYFAVLFPFWFDRRPPLLFIPLAFLLAGGYLLYICLYTGGHWFLSFAFPVTLLTGALTTGSVALFRGIRHSRLLLTGALLIVIGASMMLVELFASITFHTRMFTWSLYCVCGFSAIGLFLLLCGLIRPWRAYLERKFFL